MGIRKHKISLERSRTFIGFFVIACAIIATVISGGSLPSAHAACPPLQSAYGTVTNTVNVPTDATYRIWVRLKTADVSMNSATMQVDSTLCNVNLQATGITANTWMWVGSVGGVAANYTTQALTAGSHTITIAGNADGVMVARIILTQDLACVPSGTGDNCALPPDTTPPTVSITSPVSNTSIFGAFTVRADALDDVSVSKVEFYVDGVLKATSTAAPYVYNAPAGLSVGSHTLMAKAYDSSANSASSAIVSVVVPTPTGTPPSALSADINGDGTVNLLDFSLLASNFNKSAAASSSRRADINNDGIVNLLDFSLLAGQYGKHL